jgi:hypothetical protein
MAMIYSKTLACSFFISPMPSASIKLLLGENSIWTKRVVLQNTRKNRNVVAIRLPDETPDVKTSGAVGTGQLGCGSHRT